MCPSSSVSHAMLVHEDHPFYVMPWRVPREVYLPPFKTFIRHDIQKPHQPGLALDLFPRDWIIIDGYNIAPFHGTPPILCRSQRPAPAVMEIVRVVLLLLEGRQLGAACPPSVLLLMKLVLGLQIHMEIHLGGDVASQYKIAELVAGNIHFKKDLGSLHAIGPARTEIDVRFHIYYLLIKFNLYLRVVKSR